MATQKRLPPLPIRILRFAGIALALGLVAWAAAWGSCRYRATRALDLADAQLHRGLAALAADTLEDYRHELVSTERSCQVLLASYFQARRVDRLEWAAQACLDNHREEPEVYLALAAAREMTGRDDDAITILQNALPSHEKSPALYYSLAQLLRKNKRTDEAVAAYRGAVERSSDDPQPALDLLRYFLELQRWSDARPLAEALKSAKTDNAEVKLTIARALLKGGDAAGAKVQADQGMQMAAKDPSRSARLEKEYSDVLGGR